MSDPVRDRGREADGLPSPAADRTLRASSAVLTGIGLVLIGLGAFLLLVRPGFVLLPEDVRFTRITPDQLRAAHDPLFDWIGLVFRSWGAFVMGFGILVAGTARGAYRRGERGAWLTLAIAGIIPLSIFLGVNLALGSDFSLAIGLLLLAYVGALVVPFRRFLPARDRRRTRSGDR